jgi:DNA-directed RNA polymerase subunit beta'
MNANKDYEELRGELGEEHTGDERLRLYNSFKAVAGLGDPISTKSQQQRVRGLLKHVFGGSPKMGMYQRRLMGAAVDTVGRGVITPNPSLNMDQVGLPENKAWVLYRPFVMRHLVRRGMSAMAAAKAIEDQTPVARRALTDTMSSRPVIINRAPVLHRYGMMAAWPILVKGDTLQVPPIVTSGFNADFDGDAMNYHVPVSDDAVQDAVSKMLPSRNLKSVSDFDVHYFPKQEFLHGLHLASTAKKRGLKTFRNKEDVIKAYKRGELDVGDQVEFRE